MEKKLATCICKRWSKPCDKTATQEDFLCDPCRQGCSLFEIYDKWPGKSAMWSHDKGLDFSYDLRIL